jgi:hypothetical protein
MVRLTNKFTHEKHSKFWYVTGWGPAAQVEGSGACGRRRWREEGEAAAASIRPLADGMGASRPASACGGRGFFYFFRSNLTPISISWVV